MTRTRKSKAQQRKTAVVKISQRRQSSASLSPPPPSPKRKHSKNRNGHIPRPPNPFVLFRSFYIENYAGPTTQQNQLSKQAGEVWKAMSDDDPTKLEFQAKARLVKEQHALKYPGWRYNNPNPHATISTFEDDEPAPRPRSATTIRIPKKEIQSPRVVPEALPKPVVTPEFGPYQRRAAATKAAQQMKRLAKEEARYRCSSPRPIARSRLASPTRTPPRDASPEPCDESLATPPPASPSMSSSSSNEWVEVETPPATHTAVECSMAVDFEWEKVRAEHGCCDLVEVPFLLDIDGLTAAELREEPQAGFEVKNPATMWSAPEAPFLRDISPEGFTDGELDISFGPDITSTALDLDPLYLDIAGMFEGDELFRQQFPAL